MDRQKVLVADDEETVRYVFSGVLEHEGLEVATAADGEEALRVFDEFEPDLVLLDVVMPKLNGLEVCERLKGNPKSCLTPVVMITASSIKQNRIRALQIGADDFLSKPVDRIELVARVRSLLRIKRYTDELESAETVLMALARSIEGKDPYTEGHCERLSFYAARLGRRLMLPDDQLVALRRAGVLHDVGKVAVPDAILLKPGPLTEEERRIMREHAIVGEKICRGLKSFRYVLPIIRHHHEKINGTGYPDGLKGDEIPLTARILTIVDVFDALSTKRPYRDALPLEQVRTTMQEEVDNGWWDPDLFHEFLEMLEEETGLLAEAKQAESLVTAGAF
jgi:putative two-component system response regulator